MKDDSTLIREYLAGNEDAIEVLVTRYQKMVFAIAYRMTGDMERAKDLTQESLVRAVQGLGRFRMESSFKTWLYRIAANVCLNHLRKKPAEEKELEEGDAKTGGALDRLVEQERESILKKAVRLLPDRQRLAVTLRAHEGLSCSETAHVMGCSEGAVKAHYHNGVKRLREILKEHGYEVRA